MLYCDRFKQGNTNCDHILMLFMFFCRFPSCEVCLFHLSILHNFSFQGGDAVIECEGGDDGRVQAFRSWNVPNNKKNVRRPEVS